MADDLVALEELAGGLIRSLAPPARAKLLRSMARDLRKSQGARIGRQQQPDGTSFAPRKQRKEPKPADYSLKFLYPDGAGAPRLCFLKVWTRAGESFTGYDSEARAIRTFDWDKVVRFLPVEPADAKRPGGALRKRGSLRRQAMFRKLRTARYLQVGTDDLGAWIGFSGRAAEIAAVHQFGRRDAPRPGMREVDYPMRRLLGVTEAERERMVEALLAHVARA